MSRFCCFINARRPIPRNLRVLRDLRANVIHCNVDSL